MTINVNGKGQNVTPATPKSFNRYRSSPEFEEITMSGYIPINLHCKILSKSESTCPRIDWLRTGLSEYYCTSELYIWRTFCYLVHVCGDPQVPTFAKCTVSIPQSHSTNCTCAPQLESHRGVFTEWLWCSYSCGWRSANWTRLAFMGQRLYRIYI